MSGRQAVTVLVRALGAMSLLPWIAVAALVASGGPSWSGVLYVAAAGGVTLGLLTFPGGRGRRPRGVTRAALALIVVVACTRAVSGSSGASVTMVTADGGGPRLVGRVVDEGDVAVAATRVLVASRSLTDDAEELPGAMRAAYAQMRKEEGDAPSPLFGTYVARQSPAAFDLVAVRPRLRREPRSALIFLHGYAGAFVLPCWQVARAVEPLGVAAACPSTSWTGDWGSAAGEAAVRRTVERLRTEGITRFVLVGLSNGGIGASRLAPRMRGTFAGLVLVSGLDPSAPAPGIPALVVQGRTDSMAPRTAALAYARRHRAEYAELDAGHFAMLVRADAFDRRLRAFVAARLLR